MPAIKRVVVGYDGSADAAVALTWAARLAVDTGAQLDVVHAVGLLEHAGFTDVRAHEENALQIATDCGADPGAVAWSMVDGDPCSSILRAASGPPHADLVVVGSRGAGGHGGLMLGSTSHQLVQDAPVPVVVVPMATVAQGRG